MALPPSAVDALNTSQMAVDDLVNNNLGQIPEGLSPDEVTEYMARQRTMLEQAMQTIQVLNNTQSQVGEIVEDGQSALPVAASSYFSLERVAQGMGIEPIMTEEPPAVDAMEVPTQEASPDPSQALSFGSHVDLFNWMEEQVQAGADSTALRQQLISAVGDNDIITSEGLPIEPAEVIADIVPKYVEAFGPEPSDTEMRAQLAERIFQVMPQQDSGSNEISVVERTVAETNATIRRAAMEYAAHQKKAKGESFNLKKTAQHKSLENVIVHGPNGNRIDPFTGYLISDWHVYERNKGWGLRAGDAPFVDYEAVWRDTVMDKYSRPFRDKDGNWVGGYIQKRFEVDKWIPETNNLQLKPGQRRKPYLAEYRSHEARLQDLRSKEDPRGREFSDTSKPFNWKEASSAKKKVTG